jgi:short-subunit dehydrogenase
MQIAGQRIILTGAASGIGRALLAQLSDFECRVLACDRDAARLAAAAAECGGRRAEIDALAVDLSAPAATDAQFERAVSAWGGVDLFVANSGFAYYGTVGEPDWEKIADIFRSNVFAAIYGLQRMAALNRDRPYGCVVTASAMAKMAVPGYALYAATKAALDRFADAYRFELEPHAYLALVYPVATRTGFFAAAGERVPVPWPSQTPETVARAVVRGVLRGQTSIYPSPAFRATHLVGRFLPVVPWLYQRAEQARLRRWLADRDSSRTGRP